MEGVFHCIEALPEVVGLDELHAAGEQVAGGPHTKGGIGALQGCIGEDGEAHGHCGLGLLAGKVV